MLNPAVMFGGTLGTIKAKDIIIIILKQQGIFQNSLLFGFREAGV